VPHRNEVEWENELRRHLEYIVYKKLVNVLGEYVYKIGYVEWSNGGPVEEDWLHVGSITDYIVDDLVNAIKAMVNKEYRGCLEIYDEDIKKAVKEINDKYNLGLWLC